MEKEQKSWGTTALRLALAAVVLGSLLLGRTAPIARATDGKPEGITTFSSTTTQTAKQLVPMGRTVGIKLFSDGVLVVGLSEIKTSQGAVTPAKDCGLKEGDIITHINSAEVDTIEEVQTLLQEYSGRKMSIRAMRGEKSLQVTAQGVQAADGSYKLGAWIRDSMAGIGTMTFYDPESGLFGALGHGISDVDTQQLMPLQSGAIMYSSVTDVKKGAAGAPGELHGAFGTQTDLGALFANTESGIFGTLPDASSFHLGDALPVAARKEVSLGKATILSNIKGDCVEEYEVEITRVFPQSDADTRDLMIKVTDPRLLETTGGIVQGMSGSPILQGGRLVGAVTHVLVNDPTCGYGILAERMFARICTA